MKIFQEAKATAESIASVAQAINADPGNQALKLKLTERYIESMSNILAKSNIVMMPPGGGSLNSTIV